MVSSASASPDLKFGTTIECFQAAGVMPVTIEVLKMYVIYAVMTGRESLIKWCGIPSESYEQVFFKYFKARIMVSSFVGEGRNISLVLVMLTVSVLEVLL